MSRLFFALLPLPALLLACGSDRRDSSTGVGNPGDAAMSMAAASDVELIEIELPLGDVVGTDCAGVERYRRPVDETLDLLDRPLVSIAPPDSAVAICTLSLHPTGPLALRAAGLDAHQGETLMLRLDVPLIRLVSAEPFRPGKREWTIELGEPGWLDEGLLEPAWSDGQLEADDPLLALLEDRIAHGSGLYADADGILDEEDRAEGPVAAGVAREERRPTDLEPLVVAVGEGGRRSTSFDGGRSWTLDEEDGAGTLWSVAAGRGRFVAVGAGGRGLLSFDGQRWQTLDIAESQLIAVTFGDGRFVAVGDDGQRAWSYDGLSWNLAFDVPESNLWSVGWGEPGFVGVGQGGARAFSPDAESWLTLDWTGLDLKGVAWNGERYAMVGAGGQRFISEDGLGWTDVSEGTDDLHGVAWTGSRFVAGSGTTLHHSLDGETWTVDAVEGPQKIAAGPGFLVANGAAGDRYWSEGGLDWTQVAEPGGEILYGIAVLPR